MNEQLIDLSACVQKIQALAKGSAQVLSIFVDRYGGAQVHLTYEAFTEAFRGCVASKFTVGKYDHLEYVVEGVKFTACREITPVASEVML